jgi:DNA-binding beta-propeller fold protein YncE
MTSHKITQRIGLALLFVLVLALSSSVEARKAQQVSIEDVSDRPMVFAPQADDTVCVYWEDFQQGAGGWVPKDPYAQPTYWHRATYTSVGVMWCGTDGPELSTPPGYGNRWTQYLTKSFTLASGSVSISYRVQYDTEQDYDVLYLDISTNGGETYTTLEYWSGNSGGFETDSTSLNSYAGMPVVIRFRFESDGSYSDEDGLINTDGAARLDYVQVTGSPMDDFESSDNGWVASTRPTLYSYRFEETPACEDTLPCSDYCFSWVAYDSVTGVFPFETALYQVELAIESPVITIPGDATKYLLKFDVYRNLPNSNLVYYTWEVAAPPPEQGGSWVNDNYVYYGGGGFYTYTVDITSHVPTDTTHIKVRLKGIDMCTEWGGPCLTHTSAPIFDNVAIYALNTHDPGVDDSEFPTPCGADTDSDGVFGAEDLCGAIDASYFDSDGDGCIDDGAGYRHIEYWSRDRFPMSYYINSSGEGNITDGSDFNAIQSGMSAWTTIPGIEAAVTYAGTNAQQDAQAFDRVNLVTFKDPDYRFGVGTIAVGITTSFIAPTFYGNRWYRPGQIVDVDMIFNPAIPYRTISAGPPTGIYIEAVATHEAGHLFGLSHSATRSSTMYFVLPQGLEAASLAAEDSLAVFKVYGTQAEMAAASRLTGTIIDGYNSNPIPGAAVFVVSATTGDTLGCEYTQLDGSYTFLGLPDGNYYVGIHPLDGSSAVGYLMPAYVNDLVAGNAVTLFVSESWDSSESDTDNAVDRDPIAVSASGPDAVADIITNIDNVSPLVTLTVPDSNALNVSIDASVLISFSEPLNDATLQGNFSLTDTTTHEFVSGNASFLREDSLIAFVPMNSLSFASTYKLELDTGLEDKFGNGLAEPFVMHFTTEPEPDVALASLSPSKGVAGMIVSLNGKGFDPTPANNAVKFNGAVAAISEASPTQLVVTVPDTATSGPVNVYNAIQDKTSNSLQFTVLPSDEVPKGFASGTCALHALPRALTVLQDGSYAFVATESGADAVVVDPGLSGYMTAVAIPIQGGLTGLDAGPVLNRVYGVSSETEKFYRIDVTPGSMGVLSEKDIGAAPQGILVSSKGNRAYIPTDDGEIQIWDIDESSSSFEAQVGTIIPPDPNVRGELATDPAGEHLLAITGTGRVLVVDLDSNVVGAPISVGPSPRDIALDPVANRAYVCEDGGTVSIVSLAQSASLWTMRTGGVLRGIRVTPAGTFAAVVNRALNLIDVIDLRETSTSFLSVVATVQLPTNPVDLELSPDGHYAYTISEMEQQLVSTTLGLGPSLASLSRSAAPVGAKLVLAGCDFTSGTSTTVYFNQVAATPERLADSSLTVTAPSGATSGEVYVVATQEGGPELRSNSVYFEVLGSTGVDMLRLAATLPGTPSPAMDGGSVIGVYPSGDYIALGDESGNLHVLVSDAGNPQYHQYIGSVGMGHNAGDIVITPDGERAFVVLPDSGVVLAIGADPLKPDFLSTLATIDFSGITGSEVAKGAVSPDGRVLLVSDPGTSKVHFVDIVRGSAGEYDIVASVSLAAGDVNGVVRQMAFHPGGGYAYLPVHDSDPAAVLVLDTMPESPTYRHVVATLVLPGSPPQEMPISLSFTPRGNRCLVLTSQQVSSPNRSVVMLNTTDPDNPATSKTLVLGGTAAPVEEHIDVSPKGNRAVANLHREGLANIRIWISPDSLAMIQQIGSLPHHLTTVDSDYLPDATKFYSVSESSDIISIYDFSAAHSLAMTTGGGQSGVVGQPLPTPLCIEVTSAGSEPVEGVPVTFTVTSGGGHFAATDSTIQVVSTGADGRAQVIWTLGPDLGSQTVQAAAIGLVGSPIAFAATGLADPETLPLTVSSVTPYNNRTGVSLATSAQVTFSRAVNPATVTTSTFFLHDGDFYALPAVVGFADGNRKISLSPADLLEPNTSYWIEVKTGIQDQSGGPLSQAASSKFTTEAAPPLALGSLAPVSGAEGVTVVLSGAGFNGETLLNKVLFNGGEAYITAGGRDFLNAIVPDGAATGPVRVINTSPADTSDPIEFTVLVPETSPLNNVVGNIATGSATHGVAITPDGAFAYAVSPDGNKVTVIDLNMLSFVTSISVGENPVAITIDPEGAYAYIANHVDGTVSVIDVCPGSENYHQVVNVFPVGVGPTDVAATPDGDRLIVANAGSSSISAVDADVSSETYGAVVSSVTTSSGANTVAITPDGGLIYIGTDNGYLVISALDYGVVTSIATGSGSRTVAITPDGGLLIVLTTQGVVDIYDIQDGSPMENQVVTSLKVGSGTSSIAITPDGGLLYLIQEIGDEILVGLLNIYHWFGVTADGEELPPARVEVTLIDTLTAGEDPSEIAFDPTGSGRFVVTNAGDNTITFFAPDAKVPKRIEPYSLFQNAPNPFLHATTIRFAIPERAHVRLAVYDVTGRLVRTLADRDLTADVYSVVWNGTDRGERRVASGIYFCRMEAGSFVRTNKLLLLR